METETIDTPDGLEMLIPAECRISERFSRAVYESDLIDRAAEIADAREGVIVDGGAHIGHHTLRWVTGGQLVHAFEPVPIYRELLRRNLDLNEPSLVGSVKIHVCGLGADIEEMYYHQPEPDNTGDTRLSRDPGLGSRPPVFRRAMVFPLDYYELIEVAVIKLDVEGMEMAALRGAVGTIEQWKPSLFIECGKTHLSEVIEWTDQFGYEPIREYAKTPTWHLEAR